jgi:hypothetical protein
MIYEIDNALRAIRKDGFGSFFKKFQTFFGQIFRVIRFIFTPLPKNAGPEELVDFSFHAASVFSQTTQIRTEITQLTELVGKRKPKVVVEIGTAQEETRFSGVGMHILEPLLSASIRTAEFTGAAIYIENPGSVDASCSQWVEAAPATW